MNKKLDEKVEEIVKNPEVVEAFMDLNDLLREIVEEEEISLRKRKILRNKVIRYLMQTYW
jgi:hypothetical protein